MNQPSLILCEVGTTPYEHLETYSPFCLKVHRALRYAGLAYGRRVGRVPSDFRDLNPTGQVPVLLVEGEPVADSTDILARIESLSAQPLHADLDSPTRARALLWEELADTCINGFLVAARWADERNWPRLREAFFGEVPWFARGVVASRVRTGVLRSLWNRDVWRAGPDACWRRFRDLLDQMDATAPAQGHGWVGPRLSAADFAIFAQLHSFRCDLTPWQADELAKRSTLSAYLDWVNDATLGCRSTKR